MITRSKAPFSTVGIHPYMQAHKPLPMDRPRQYSRRNAMQLLRKISLSGSLLLALLLITTTWIGVTAAATSPAKANTFPTVREVSTSRSSNSNADLVHRLVRAGRLAPTVHVLDSLPPTTIVQFPLVPSGIKKAFPQATGLVTIVRGDRDNAFSDTVTVDVQNMPPNITFTIFYIEFA